MPPPEGYAPLALNPFTTEVIPGYNVTIWPKAVGGQVVATRIMIVSLDPAHPVDSTVLRQIAVKRVLKERLAHDGRA